MDSHYTYLLILGASLIGPLALSFDKKVAFYRSWPSLFLSMVLPAMLYICWDMIFTYRGVWTFNPAYITGQKIVNLPVEEVLFFFVVPYCCTFIYSCIKAYFPVLQTNNASKTIFLVYAVVFGILGITFYHRAYTASTCIFMAVFIELILFFLPQNKHFNLTAFLVSYAIILIPFLIVNGFLTALPVVLYNNRENLGIRIYTIPIEDVVYGMLLVMMNIVIFEKLESIRRARQIAMSSSPSHT